MRVRSPTCCWMHAMKKCVGGGGVVVFCALLVAIGITPDGHRTVLGARVSLSEAEVHWRDFLAGLQARGLHGVQLVVSDDHAGLAAARQARLATAVLMETDEEWQTEKRYLPQSSAATR